ncbi:hypothetical protein ZWY2020_025226 [Hordeum vulgare]|nr:hypothetical protein ZWY2020_025226 [Hordeum vulgare]
MSPARELFDRAPERDVVCWNAMISGRVGITWPCPESIDVFKKMLKEKVRPDEITFVMVLIACSHGGKVDKGVSTSLMQQQYRIEPNVKHHGCMVDMLGRAGLLKEAFEFIDTMKVEPNSVIWRTLLGACRVHGEIESLSTLTDSC